MARLLGIDVGTSGCKVLLIDEAGTVMGSSSAEYPLFVPQPQWSEQNPSDWWQGVQHCLSQFDLSQVDAIGVTGQMHGAVFLDENLEVIRPAILWNDQRTSRECAEIDEVVGVEQVRRITRNPPLTGFQAPKLLWLRNNEPSAYASLSKVLLPKDYIRFRLTGSLATEVSDASGTGLLDVAQRMWSSQMMSALGIDPSFLPPVSESIEVTATVGGGVPVVGGGGDQAAAAVGTGAVEPGIISVSLGTSGVVFTSLQEPNYDPSGATHTFCHANGAWHSMGVMLSCGGALRWFRDTLCMGESYDGLAAEAAQVSPGADGVTFLPYLTGERCPHNDPYAKASFAGLSLGSARPHLSRAVFEGVTFGLLDCLESLRKIGAEVRQVRVTGGGARSDFWLQLLADVFGVPCVTVEADEGPAFGAALLAGVGIGVWSSVEEACRNVVRASREFRPTGHNYAPYYQRYRQLYGETRTWNRL